MKQKRRKKRLRKQAKLTIVLLVLCLVILILSGEVLLRKKKNTAIDAKTSIWAVAPQYSYDEVDVVSSGETFKSDDINQTDFYYMHDYFAMDYQLKGNATGYYDYGVMKVRQNQKTGIVDFQGNIILPIEHDEIHYGYVFNSIDILQNDYFKMEDSPERRKMQADDLEKDRGYYDDLGNPKENRMDEPVEYAFFGNDFKINEMRSYYDYNGLGGDFGYGYTVDQASDVLEKANGALIAWDESQNTYVVVDQSGAHFTVDLNQVVGKYNKIVNGFLRIADQAGTWDSVYPEGTKIAYASTEKFITDYIYEDGYCFTDGYAAVKRNGKWGYINTEGQEVVPCQYDETRPVYHGLCWIKVDGLWGIANIEVLSKQ